MGTFNELAQEVHATATANGWHEKPVSFIEQLCLIHSEVSEAVEDFRDGEDPAVVYFSCSYTLMKRGQDARYAKLASTPIVEYNPVQTDVYRKPEGIPTELADVIIRVLDIAAEFGIDLDTAMRLKMDYNKTRGYKHGGKLL